MPRSTSTRKYRNHRHKRKHRRHSSSDDDSSYSRSRSSSYRRHKRHTHHKDHRNLDRSYRKYDRRHNKKYEDSSDSERSRHRSSSSSSSEERKHARKHHRYEHKQKHHHHKKHEKKSSDSTDRGHKDKPQIRKSSDDTKDRSKDAGHYKYRPGVILNDKYKITKHLGDGTFGRVLEAEDVRTNQVYAIKVIRAVQRYVESAQTEANILEDLKRKDPEGKYQIVRLESAFLKDPSRPHKEQNYFMVFERLGMSLYDFLKMNKYRGFGIEYIQSFAKQILMSIGFMHSIGLTHTDLKPENILLVNDEADSIKLEQDESEIDEDRSSTRSRSEEKIYYKPRYDKIKIIDMGGATYDDEHHSSVINTRQYRAPEVMLASCKWGHESDVWSIGCILLELYTGDLFFETHETYEHLAMIDRACGPIPFWMANRAESKMKKYFVLEESYKEKHKTYFDWPKYASGQQSIKRVETMKLIDDHVSEENPELRDLLKKMLTIDPNKRIKCSEALDHDFFKIDYRRANH